MRLDSPDWAMFLEVITNEAENLKLILNDKKNLMHDNIIKRVKHIKVNITNLNIHCIHKRER